MKRRHFLQFAGATLASIGLSQLEFLHQSNRYGQVLAQSTRRKLALLVGINNYPSEIGQLYGCLNDVELQRQLLIHRFGFNPNDILEISDNTEIKPTRENILNAFEHHLIKQAKPDDVVVFHYSGHGDRIRDPNPLNTPECQKSDDCDRNGTLVPLDGMPQSDQGSEVAVPDIMGRTLFLLMQAVPTEFVTVVLDSCHSGAGTRGNVTVRTSRRRAGSNQILVPSEAELAYQQRWLTELNLSSDQFQRRRQAGIAKGVAIGSAQRNQLAVDATFAGFNAGGFTYLLTRYLWQLTQAQSCQTIYTNLERSTNSVSTAQQGRAQVPVFDYQLGSQYEQQRLYFSELTSLPAEAVLLNTNPLQFWLGGVSEQNVGGNGTVFSVLNDQGEAIAEIKQTDRRDGLYGIGELLNGSEDIQPGMLLREKIIGISTNSKLNIAVDVSLNNEFTQAEAELRTVNRVEVAKIERGIAVDYLFGRFTSEYQQLSNAPAPPLGSLGLFQPDLTPINNSFGRVEEPVTAAINRLRPHLKRLLANQILGQLMTTGSSNLRVVAKLSATNTQGATVQVASRRAEEDGRTLSVGQVAQFRTGARLQVEVENLEAAQDLYLSVLVIGSNGVMDVLYPQDWTAPEQAALIKRQESLVVPRRQDGYAFEVQGPPGLPELLMLVSQEPLRNALKGMQSIARGRGISRGPIGEISEDDALNAIDQLLGDVNQISRGRDRGSLAAVPFTNESVAFDTSKMVILSMVFEVVE